MILSIWGAAAKACQPVGGYSNLRDILNADAIVHARIRDIEFLHVEAVDNYPFLALVNLSVSDVIFGTLPDHGRHRRASLDTLVNVDRSEDYLKSLETYSGVIAVLHNARDDTWHNAIDSRPAYRPNPSDLPTDINDMLQIAYNVCGVLWLFEDQSPVGRALLQIFDGEGDRDTKIEIFAKYLNMNGGRY